MILITRLLEQMTTTSVQFRTRSSKYSCTILRQFCSRLAPGPADEEKSNLTNSNEEEFRTLNLRKTPNQMIRRKRIHKEKPNLPRAQKMAIDQDWGAVWPGPKTFHPASVPLPLRQGFTEKSAPPPSKYANTELMKLQNFLHLTPPIIKKQCEALKKFCTEWPKGLENESKWNEYFPIEYLTTDYCHGLPTIRNPLARIITIRLKLSNLKFDQHAKDKFLRLLGERYDPLTDVITIVTDRCPLKKQNYDYALYLLTACYHESFILEPWEANKMEADMEYYDFHRNKSKISATAILNWRRKAENHDNDLPLPAIEINEEFIKSVENLINDGENEYNLQKYKEEAKKLLGIKNVTI